MKQLLFIIFMVILTSTNSYFFDRPRVWYRIPRYVVSQYVDNFLKENRITNCFQYRETETNLLLKCWRDNTLTDVSIDIFPSSKKKRIVVSQLSVTV